MHGNTQEGIDVSKCRHVNDSCKEGEEKMRLYKLKIKAHHVKVEVDDVDVDVDVVQMMSTSTLTRTSKIGVC